MTTRKYSSRSQKTTLSAAITSVATSANVVSGTSLMGGATLSAGQTYTVVIDPDTALEEIVDVTAVSTNTLTIVRGIDGSSAVAHSAGAEVRHMSIGRDFREANEHIENTTTAHGLTLANLIETTDTGTVTNTMLAGSIADNKLSTISTAGKVSNSATTATAANTPSTIVLRDASGNFTAGTVTGNLTGNVTGNVSGTSGSTTGNAATATALATGRTISLTGDLSGTSAAFDGTANVSITAAIGTNTIVDGDINAGAGITKTKIAGTAVTLADTGTITSTMIANNTIVDADINSGAAIARTKIANPTADVSNAGFKITNLGTPTVGTDAVTKDYADLMIPLTQKGAANGVASLGADGKLTTAQIPDVTITDTFVVASQAAMLALTAQVGDVAVRTDLNKSFILKTAGASTLANWQELLTPTDSVLSVDGQTGAVNLSSTYATVANAANKLPLAGGTMSGAIAMGTNKITGLGDPTLAQDAATKNYIDTVVLAPSNLTGPITSVGNVTSIASQTGTGTKFVVDTSPTLVTPNIGVATATSVNGTTIPTSKTLVATDSTQYVVPSQTGNSGKYLTTNGTVSSWGAVDALPSQTGNAGEYLTTDGTTASWAAVPITSAATPTVAGIVYGETSTGINDPLSIGYNALAANTTGTKNTAVGTNALDANTTGSSNTAVGNDALTAVTSGTGNTAVGSTALDSITTSSFNAAFGSGALGDITSNSSNNTALGFNSGTSFNSGTNNTFVGNGAIPSATTISNEITLGNASVTRFRIPGLNIDWTTANVPSDPTADIFMMMGA